MPTLMMAAIRPYSIAVAPDSSLRKREKIVVMILTPNVDFEFFFSSVRGVGRRP
jgi:hypothetical protein